MLQWIEKLNVKVLFYFCFYFLRMRTYKRNPPNACDLKTVKKYFIGPCLGYFSSELDEIFNITSIYRDNMYTKK